MTLTELEARVEAKLQEEHRAIVHSVLRIMLRRHNPRNARGCNCEYCQLLPEYIRAKMHYHRLRKIIEHDYIGYEPYSQLDLGVAYFNVKWLKKNKDSLKIQNF